MVHVQLANVVYDAVVLELFNLIACVVIKETAFVVTWPRSSYFLGRCFSLRLYLSAAGNTLVVHLSIHECF